jgi:NADH:ubiquinone reductase (H+-translocating)
MLQMRFLSTVIHGAIDYLAAVLLIVSPFLFGFADGGAAQWLPMLIGAAVIGYSLLTDYELGAARRIGMPGHLALDGALGLLLAASPWLYGFADRVFWPHVLLGLFSVVMSLVTETDARCHASRPAGSESDQRVLVVGAGFAGLEVAKALGRAGLPVTVVDRHNHHLFQPLLYQVATAALSATDVAEPIRRILRREKSVEVVFGEVSEIDTAGRQVRLTCGDTLTYDYLVVASGAGHGYFGHDEWAQWAPGLKTIEDARRIRSQLLLTFERAERETNPAERERLLAVAIIGGGPTGVELAGAVAELSRYTLAQDFRRISTETTRIKLIEAGPRLLPAFSDEMAAYARRRLERLGVEVRVGQPVEEVTATSIRIAGKEIPTGIVIWAAGVTPSSLTRQLGATGRIAVEPTLAVPGLSGVFALGDIAAFSGEDGRPLPGLAQVAKQQGKHLGRSLTAHIRTGAPLTPFRYRSRGNTAIVGRHAAVYEYESFKLKGWMAWATWAVVHVYLLVGFQHRLIVSMQWLWRYLTYDRGARLIAGDYAEAEEPTAPIPARGPAARLPLETGSATAGNIRAIAQTAAAEGR